MEAVRGRPLGHPFARVASVSLTRVKKATALKVRLRVSSLPAEARVSLSATLRGRKLAPVLVEGKALHRGVVTVTLKGPNLKKGTYRVTIVVGSEASAGRLVQTAAVKRFTKRIRLR